MSYEKNPVRKKLRLDNFDYSSNGAYFITICLKIRENLLWQSVGADIIRPMGKIHLSEYGRIVKNAICEIPVHYDNAYLDKFCIMPDHIHLILFLLRENRDQCGRIISAPTVNIPTIIGQMKRSVSKKIGFGIWQKSYYDHIIRNERDLNEIRKYIAENPLKWVYKNEGNI